MHHWIYLAVLLGCLGAVIPLELRLRCRVLRRPVTLLAALLPGGLLFAGWDLYAVHAHQWSYDPRHILGVFLPGGLPLEEVLFFLVIPTCAVLTFEAVQRCVPDRAPAEVVEPARQDAA